MLLNYLKTEFKIHKKHSWCCSSRTCSQYTWWPMWHCMLNSTTWVTMHTGYTFCCHNTGNALYGF